MEQLPTGAPTRCWHWLLGARLAMSETTAGQFFFDEFFKKKFSVLSWPKSFFFHKQSWTALHFASLNGRASAFLLLCALDGVDLNAVNNEGMTALDLPIGENDADCVRALLELNVDTSNARVMAWTSHEILQLLDEHRKRSVKTIISFLFRILKVYVMF